MPHDACSGIAGGCTARVDRQPADAHFQRSGMTEAVPDGAGRDVLDPGFLVERLFEPRPAGDIADAGPERLVPLSRNPRFPIVRARAEQLRVGR